MRTGVLGAVELWGTDGSPVSLGGPRPRALLAALALNVGRPVPLEQLVDAMYGEEPPGNAQHALQSQVSRIRALLPPGSVTRHPVGYLLTIDPDEVDAHRFERLAASGRKLLALGDHANARKAVTEDHPYRERLRGQRMWALAADGRQAEALASFDDARRTLADEFGADPTVTTRPPSLRTRMRLMPYLPGTAKIMEKVKAELRDVACAIELPETRSELRTEAVRNAS